MAVSTWAVAAVLALVIIGVLLLLIFYVSPQMARRKHGREGQTGPTGPAGADGSAVNTGAQGPIGPLGPTGQQGPMGSASNTGAQGPTGFTGAMGTAANTGAPGPAGPTGAVGPMGAAANTGAPGATGSVGPSGPTGASPNPGLIVQTGSVEIFAALGSTGPFVDAITGLPIVAGSTAPDQVFPVLLRYAQVGPVVTVELPVFEFDIQGTPDAFGRINAPGLIPIDFAPTSAAGDTTVITTFSSAPTGPAYVPTLFGSTQVNATGFTFNGRSTGRLDIAADGSVSIYASNLLNLAWGQTGNIIDEPSSTSYIIF